MLITLLAYVQIDHTPLDIEIVDDEFREAIGKPHLTLAIDVFSRMIVGYYLSRSAKYDFSGDVYRILYFVKNVS